jgi:hypothetical protein
MNKFTKQKAEKKRCRRRKEENGGGTNTINHGGGRRPKSGMTCRTQNATYLYNNNPGRGLQPISPERKILL